VPIVNNILLILFFLFCLLATDESAEQCSLISRQPSELLGLRWSDIDMKAGFLCISKSGYLDRHGATKTVGSDRTIRLLSSVVDLLKQIKPLKATGRGYIFLNKEGATVELSHWHKGVWYRILRGLEIRPRKPYSTRHTFISRAEQLQKLLGAMTPP
jgi:integrase